MKAKIVVMMMVCMMVTCALYASRGAGRTSVDHVGLLAPSYAKVIKPSDFNAGPVVITQPGYYVLSSSVTFNPQCPYNLDTVGNPWDAAVIILADHVVFDLNANSIGQVLSDDGSQNFKVIKLGGMNPLTMDSSVAWYTPKDVVIKNGSIGASTGFGIYGQDNEHVTCVELSISDCAKGGIFLENLSYSYLKNISIVGSELTTGNGYGIFLRDNSLVAPYWTSIGDGDHGPVSVVLENISVADIYTQSTMDAVTEASIYMQELHDLLNTTPLANAANVDGVAGIVYGAAQDLIDDLEVLKTLLITYLGSIDSDNNAAIQGKCSDILADIVTLGIAYDADVLANGTFVVNTTVKNIGALYGQLALKISFYADVLLEVVTDGVHDYVGEVEALYDAWASYGIRVVQGKSITLKNCAVSHVSVTEDEGDYTVAAGVALGACQGVICENSSVNSSWANSGFSVGFITDFGSSGITFNLCDAMNCGGNDSVYGFFCVDSKGLVYTHCNAIAMQGVTTSSGFFAYFSSGITFERCKSYSHSCALQEELQASLVIGFASEAGLSNSFIECEAYDLIADTNYVNSSYIADMKAIGFYLTYFAPTPLILSYWDRGTIVDRCKAYNNDGCCGSAIGIYLDGAVGSTVTNNRVSMQMAREKASTDPDVFAILGNGYGIYDTADDTSALIVKNMSYANQTRNYKVNFSLPNEKLPLAQSTYGDMTGVYMANEWDNISLQPNPGAAGCVDACTDLQEFF